MPGVEIREMRPGDEAEVLALLQASLGWEAAEPYTAFYRWKHDQNPFGCSAAWVAVDGDRIVGFRTFLRWEWQRSGQAVRSVRAVDTATHPAYRGRGLFSQLTLQALEVLRHDGAAFVFNTPNDQSRPGYLKMGWQTVGRIPITFAPRSVAALPRIARARVPAGKWSIPTEAGRPALEALAGDDAVSALLAATTVDDGRLRTHLSPEYLRWRFAFPELAYRVLDLGSLEEGAVAFRLRPRGAAVEAVIAQLLVPRSNRRGRAELVRRVTAATGADYAVMIGERSGLRPPRAGLPRQGPVMTWRALGMAEMPPIAAWDLTMGDIELF